jgi:FkbM family methyltransferase
MLLRKLAAYLRELAYIFSATNDVRSRVALLWHTMRYHAMIAYKPGATKGRPFTINLRIRPEYDKALCLRPFAKDLSVLYQVFLNRRYYLPRSLLLPDGVRVIIDCDANVGIAALFLASRYPNARIFCVEPRLEDYDILKRNTQSEARIVPINATVVGRLTASIRLTSNEPARGNKSRHNDPGIEVPQITISEICTRHSLERIDLLRIDMEGAEESVFAHAEFLPRVRLGIIELYGHYTKRMFDVDLAKWDFVSTPPQPESGLKMLTFRRKLDWLYGSNAPQPFAES